MGWVLVLWHRPGQDAPRLATTSSEQPKLGPRHVTSTPRLSHALRAARISASPRALSALRNIGLHRAHSLRVLHVHSIRKLQPRVLDSAKHACAQEQSANERTTMKNRILKNRHSRRFSANKSQALAPHVPGRCDCCGCVLTEEDRKNSWNGTYWFWRAIINY